MQFINKRNTEPIDWNLWFKVPPDRRTYDFGKDRESLPLLRLAKQCLIEEQYSLCAYCQQRIDIEGASIEHVIPKEHNKYLSTSYFNLVAVCNRNQVKDPLTEKLHCDRIRGSKLVPPIIFHANAKSGLSGTNYFFMAYGDGLIAAKPGLEVSIKNQVEAFINILNLNHSILKEKRSKDILRGLTSAYLSLSNASIHKKNFWRIQYERILNNKNHQFREYLLVFIGSKIRLI